MMGEVLDAFDLGGRSADPYGEGYINGSYVVQGPTRRYLLQRVNTDVFCDPAGLMDNIVNVTEYLRHQIASEGGDPDRETLTVVPTRDGAHFHTATDGSAWRCYLFVADMVCHQTAETPEVFAVAARGFGRFFARLDGYPVASLHTTIPSFHDTRVRFRECEQAWTLDPMNRARDCIREIDFALARQGESGFLMEMLEAGDLPLRVTHNDTKLNNVLMDPVTGAECVIDLDTVMPGLVALDFGDAIRYGANTGAEDETDLSRVGLSLPLFEAYAKAYLHATGTAMTAAEKGCLAWGAKLITYENGMRFLTDYLLGDVYYRTDRPDHNLDRCRTQFALVADMESKFATMVDIVAGCGV